MGLIELSKEDKEKLERMQVENDEMIVIGFDETRNKDYRDIEQQARIEIAPKGNN
jgi:hypothetical protein